MISRSISCCSVFFLISIAILTFNPFFNTAKGIEVPAPSEVEIYWPWDDVYKVQSNFMTSCGDAVPVVSVTPSLSEADLILVLDSSYYEAIKDPEDYRAQAVIQLIDLLDPSINVGIVDFSSDARIVHQLSSDHGSVASAALGIGTRGTPDEHAAPILGLEMALLDLEQNGREDSQAFIVMFLADPDPELPMFNEYASTIHALTENNVVVSSVYLGDSSDNGNSFAAFVNEMLWARASSPAEVAQVDLPEDLVDGIYGPFIRTLPRAHYVELYMEDEEAEFQFVEMLLVDFPWDESPPLGAVQAQFLTIPIECWSDVRPTRLAVKSYPWTGNQSQSTAYIGTFGECSKFDYPILPVQREISVVQGLSDYSLEKTRVDGSKVWVPPYSMVAGKDTQVRINLGFGSLAAIWDIDVAILAISHEGIPVLTMEGRESESGWRVWDDLLIENMAGDSWEFFVDGETISSPGQYTFSVTLYKSGLELANVEKTDTFCSVDSSPTKALFVFMEDNLLEEPFAEDTIRDIFDYLSVNPFPTDLSQNIGAYWDYHPETMTIPDECKEPNGCWNIIDPNCPVESQLYDILTTYNLSAEMPARTSVGYVDEDRVCWHQGEASHGDRDVISSNQDSTLPHEMGHFMGHISGRDDPGFGGGGSHSINRYTCGSYGCEDWGWYPLENRVRKSTASVMYEDPRMNYFFERYQYNYSMDKLSPRCSMTRKGSTKSRCNGAMFVLYGQITSDDRVTVSNSFITDRCLEASSTKPSEYDICFINDNGDIILTWPVIVNFYMPFDPDIFQDPTHFSVTVPFPEDTSTVTLRRNSTVLWSKRRSDNAPILSITSPNGGEYFNRNDNIDVTWNGNDADGDELIYDVFYSNDNGSTYKLASALNRTEGVALKSSLLPGSDEYIIKVVASDGFNRSEDISDNNFSIEGKPPIALILSPTEDGIIYKKDTLQLVGLAFDLEDGVIKTGLQWSVDDGSPIESGSRATIPMPDPGQHTIHLTVADSDGNVVSKSGSINAPGSMTPIANAGAAYVTECQNSDGASAVLDGSASRDPMGQDLFYLWEADGVALDDPRSVTPSGFFPLGATTVSLFVSNGGEESKTDRAAVGVVDTTPPLLSLPDDVVAECHDISGTPVNPGSATAVDVCSTFLDVWFEGPDLFPVGTTFVEWYAEDESGNVSSGQQSVHVVDTTPPSLVVPNDVVVECLSQGGTIVDIGNAVASDDCSATVEVSNNAPARFLPGTTEVVWQAVDEYSNASSGIQKVTVQDTFPPILAFSLSPSVLWPPNHKMVDIFTEITVFDVCDPSPGVVLTSIESNEPDDSEDCGDGRTTDDIQDASYGTDDRTFRLRAERCGGGNDRTYTVVYSAFDSWTNSVSKEEVVTVPHDMGNN